MTTLLRLRRADGAEEDIPLQAAGVDVAASESFELQGPPAGGLGDSLMRPVELVAHDVAAGRITAPEAEAFYGVVALLPVAKPDFRPLPSASMQYLRCPRPQARRSFFDSWNKKPAITRSYTNAHPNTATLLPISPSLVLKF